MLTAEAELTDVLVAAGTLLRGLWLSFALPQSPLLFTQKVLELVLLGCEGADLLVNLLHLSAQSFHYLLLIGTMQVFLLIPLLLPVLTEG